MKFSDYLLNESNILFSSFWKDGTIIVLVDGERQTFIIDSMYHNKIKKLSEKEPEKALEQLNNWVERGWATKI
jgi:hypothetical protein